MLAGALIFLVIVLLVFRPLAQKRRERAIAEKLKDVRDPVEAGVIIDGLIHTTRHESNFVETLLSRIWPSLYR